MSLFLVFLLWCFSVCVFDSSSVLSFHFMNMAFFWIEILLAAALLTNSSTGLPSYTEPTVKLLSGDTINGSICPGGLVKRFRGIPFAQPPTGSLRFMPPKQIEGALRSDGDIFDASNPGAPCHQYKDIFTATNPTPSEDWYASKCGYTRA